MVTRTVYVSLQGQGNSTNLRLRDSEQHDGINDITTLVDAGDTVQWQVDQTPPNGASPIYSIEKVYKYQDSDPLNYSLLISDPVKNGDVWQGVVVKPSEGEGKYEKYNIDFKRTADDNVHTDDPKLQMNA